MKLIIFITLLASVSCSDEAERRDGISYSTTVLHGDPKYPDQQAQSSVDFKLETDNTNYPEHQQHHTQQPQPQQQHYLQQQHHNQQQEQQSQEVSEYTTPKSVQEYQKRTRGGSYQSYANLPVYGTQAPYRPPTQATFRQVKSTPNFHNVKPQFTSYHGYNSPKPQRSPFSSTANSQSFNVGYSVKFTNNNNERPKGQSFKPPRFESSEIITGSRKEEVKKPTHITSSGGHHMYVEPKPSFSNQVSQAHVTPKTQEQLAYLENMSGGKLQGQNWGGPTVEIFKSKEINVQNGQNLKLPTTGFDQTFQKFAQNFDQKYGQSFDHQKAIGKSEGFDYSNAVDFNGMKQQNYLTPQYAAQTQVFSLASPYSADLKSGQFPKLPIDTSLLRDPVLTLQKQPVGMEGKQIPIHFDTSLIQEAGQSYKGLFDEINPTGGPYIALSNKLNTVKDKVQSTQESPTENQHQQNLQQFNNIIAEQSQNVPYAQSLYQEPPEENDPLSVFSQNTKEMKFGYPQNGLFNPSVHKMPPEHKYKGKVIESYKSDNYQKPKMYMVNENVHEHNQPPQTQFKIFSKPPNSYMRHQYEKHHKRQKNEPPRQKNEPPRQPRINPKRGIRDFNIETDLRPPPMPYTMHRLRRIQPKHDMRM